MKQALSAVRFKPKARGGTKPPRAANSDGRTEKPTGTNKERRHPTTGPPAAPRPQQELAGPTARSTDKHGRNGAETPSRTKPGNQDKERRRRDTTRRSGATGERRRRTRRPPTGPREENNSNEHKKHRLFGLFQRG